MSAIMKKIKNLYSCFYDRGECLRQTPVGSIERMNLPQENIEFLKDFMTFIMNSNILNKVGRIYVTSPRDSIKGIFREYSTNNPDDAISLKSAQNGLDYCRRKILQSFDEPALSGVMEREDDSDLITCWGDLEIAKAKYYKGRSLFADIKALDIPVDISEMKPSLMDIDCFTGIISAYRASEVKDAQQNLSAFLSVAAYFNWLHVKERKTEEELDLYNKMVRFLSGDTEDVVSSMAAMREYEDEEGLPHYGE